MSASPPKETDVEGVQSPEEADAQVNEISDPQGAGMAYEFEVKEQDRWLPIANASEKCHQEKRKTVNGEDILFAMTSLGFENYAEALKIYLSKYRETQSARGENQNRPGSQGYGSTAPGSGQANTSSSGTFQAGAEGANNILAGQQAEGGEHDAASYGGLYGGQVATGHNGATGTEYQ
ncbi:hypothetical protein DH86_00000136 [Scytalidium sp. 3C]|nr:hypothetical protein DH86_00000136 [Scytalidium sp. 3C]